MPIAALNATVGNDDQDQSVGYMASNGGGGMSSPPTNYAPLNNVPNFDPRLGALMIAPPGPESPYARRLSDASDALLGNPKDVLGALQSPRNRYDKATQGKMSAIQRAIDRLSSAGQDQFNLPALAMAAGFNKPGDGDWSTGIANAAEALGPVVERQRQTQRQLAEAIGNLGISGADADIQGAKGDYGFTKDQFDLADKFANQAGQIQGRADLVNARNRSADLAYAGKMATSGMAPFGATGGISGISPNDLASKIAGIENTTGNPAAKNPLSSATGNGQFINGTWLPLIKSIHPELAAKLNDAQLLALRSDPDISRQMIVENAKRNSQILDSVGLPSNMTTLALAHRFGPQATVALLHAPNDAPMASLLPPEVLAANPTLAHQTAGQYIDGLQKQVGDEPVSADNGILSVETTGDEYLKSLPTPIATQVKALAEGRMAFPTGYQLTKPYWQNMLQAVSKYDPNFDAVNYNARAAARKDFTSGKSAQNITSFNTAIGHLDALDNSIDDLNNGSMPWLNNISNTISTNMGDTRYQKAAANFSAAKNAVVDELTRAFRGSGGNVHDIEGWERTLNTADSPAALHQAVRQAVTLLKSRIDAVGEQYQKGMGTTADPMQLLTPKARDALERLDAVRINSDAEYDKLPPNTFFIGPDGHTRQKP